MKKLEFWSAVAGIVGSIAAVIALWPVFFPPSPPPAPPLEIPEYSTGWIEGDRKSTRDYCNPRKEAWEKQYPNFTIEMTLLPEQHKENRDMWGIKHDRYLYSCRFAATPKN